MNVKLDYFKVFYEAAKCESFSKASQTLYMTQSAISQTIQTLEKELDTTLFIRNKKGVTLTKEGFIVFQKVSQAMEYFQSATREIENMKNLDSGELIIGAGDTFCQYYLIQYLVLFQTKYPNIHLKVMNGTSSELIEMLKSHTIDIAFINMPYTDKQIHLTPCMTIHDIFISHKEDHHLYTLEEIAQKQLILLERQSNSRIQLDHYFKENGIDLHPSYELGAHELLLTFTSFGMGISCVIKEFSKKYLNQSVFELKLKKPLPERQIGYAHLNHISLSNSAKAFIDLLDN